MNEPSPRTLSIALADEAATARLMADLALLIRAGDVITLSGELGTGKTAAARAMIRHLAQDGTLDVPSPTFTLAQTYELATIPVLHADLYRIADTRELEELGLAPLPDNLLVLLEWPERAANELPADRIEIVLSMQPERGADARLATVTGHGAAEAKVVRLGQLRDFLGRAGFLEAQRLYMPGDASTRSYARLVREGTSTILMNFPPRVDQQRIYGGRSYLAAVHLADEIKPFVAIARGLQERGFSAPAVYHCDLERGFLIGEDLGTEAFVEGNPPRPIVPRYEAAIDVLAELHRLELPTALAVEGASAHAIAAFDVDAMLIELSLLLDWYFPDRGLAVTDTMRAEFDALWRALLTPILQGPRTWVIRDYHSPNLIWLEQRSGIAKVGIIDFQDMVLGPAAYDVVSLAQDARLDIAEPVELALLSRYVRNRRAREDGFDPTAFAESYAVMSAQRNTRLLGVFSRLNRRDGKPHYLRHQPRIWTYLARSLAHPALATVKDWYGRHLPPD